MSVQWDSKLNAPKHVDDGDGKPKGDTHRYIKKTTKRHYPMEGVEFWENEKNGFTVFQLHFTANPVKRDPRYLAKVKGAMPIRKFQQEYNLIWDSFQGLPVFGDWNKKIHGSKDELGAHIGLPLLIGVDFGLTPAAIVCQLQGSTLVCLKEFVKFNMGAERFSSDLRDFLGTHYPEWYDLKRDIKVFIDPSGTFRKDTDERTCAMIMAKYGFRPIPGAITWEERRSAVERLLTKTTKRGPGLLVDMANCPLFVRGFEGGYRYNEKAADVEPNKLRPIKDDHSHVADAFQYLATGIARISSGPSIVVPIPAYTMTMGDN